MTRVVVVEDDLDLLSLTRLSLEQAGAQVEGYRDPAEAMRSDELRVADVVLSDYRMPGFSGADVLARAHEVNPTARLVLFSALASDDGRALIGEDRSGDVELLVRLGVLILPKPFPVPGLLRAVGL